MEEPDTAQSSSRRPNNLFLRLLTWVVFTSLDLLDALFCVFFSYIDHLLEGCGNALPCYCHKTSKVADSSNEVSDNSSRVVDRENQMSETLFRRRNVFRGSKMGRISVLDAVESKSEKKDKPVYETAAAVRWSDCGCGSCVSWTKQSDPKIHFVLKEPNFKVTSLNATHPIIETENVILLHGFISSSSIWTETVFPNLSDSAEQKLRLFAVDLLGFGRSPKPRDCDYTLKDHVDAIEKAVISPFGLDSFHIVAHSMGCIIALALAAKHPTSVKSLTLVAPPYFPLSNAEDNASLRVLEILAAKRLWPPLLFGAAVMSWYEHLGRVACFIVCRTHRFWESILKLVTGQRELSFLITDIVRHTHHSGWHTMHNVICGGAKLMDGYLETVGKFGVKVVVIQGDRDQLVPLECSRSLVKKVDGAAEFRIVWGEDHNSIVIDRAKEFTKDLEKIWASSS